MLLAVRISSYGCTWEVWRALKKLELLSTAARATLTLLSCSPNFPRASITRYTLSMNQFLNIEYNETILQRVLCDSYGSVILAKKEKNTEADKQL